MIPDKYLPNAACNDDAEAVECYIFSDWYMCIGMPVNDRNPSDFQVFAAIDAVES